MSSLTGHTALHLQQKLGGLVYRNPEGAWETDDKYTLVFERQKTA